MPLRRSQRERSRPTRLLRTKRLILAILAVFALTGAAYGLHNVQMRRQATLLHELGQKAAADGAPLRAVDFHKQYLALKPDDLDAQSELAGLYEELAKAKPGFAQEAIAILEEKVLNADPARHDDRLKLAKLYFQINKTSAARQHANQLLAAPVRPLDAEVYLLLARCDRREKKIDDARTKYDRALATKRAPATTYREFAQMLRYEIATPQAIVEADRAMNRLIQDRPADREARVARSQYRLKGGDRRGAREDIEVAFTLAGGAQDVDTVLQFAALTVLDDPKRALELLEDAQRDHPENPQLTLGLAEMLIAGGNIPEARQRLLHAARQKPDGSPALLEIGDRLIDLNDTEAALVCADRLVLGDRNPAGGAYLRGRVAIARGAWPQGVPQLETALPALQRNALLLKKAHLALADGYGAAGDTGLQLRSYEAARTADPNSWAAQFGLADTLVKVGQLAQALNHYRDLAPSYPAARIKFVQLSFAEILGKPDAERNWVEFERILGPKSYAPEIEAIAAQALYVQNKAPEAIRQLDAAIVTDPKRVQAWLTLALLRGLQDVKAGIATLDEAEQKVGENVDLRLLRAQLLLRDPNAKPISAVQNLAERRSADFPTAERGRLWNGLAEMLAGSGANSEAIALLKRSTAESPFDLSSRLMLFDLANALPDAAVRDATLDEIRKLDGLDGAVTIVAEAARELVMRPKPTEATANQLAARLASARGKRESWGRIHVLLGDVAFLIGRPDAALADYRKALERGERGEALLRRVVQLLWERQNYQEATQLLAQVTTNAALPSDLRQQFLLMRSALSDDRESSLKWVRSPAVADTKNYRDQLTRGTVFFMHGATDEAMAAFQQAKSLEGDAPEIWVSIVRFLAATGQKAAAVKQTDEAVRHLRRPENKTGDAGRIALALGECREYAGDPAAAETEYRRAWELRPSDPAAAMRLYVLYLHSARVKDADAVLNQALAAPKSEAALWARRTQALALVSGSDAFKSIDRAVAMLDDNLRDGNNALDDIRAKAFVIAIDPFQRAAGINQLVESAAKSPLTPEQNYFLAKLYLQSGQPDLAEKALIAATRAGPLAAPDHMAMLAHVQLDRNSLVPARQTLNRLKLRVPNSWESVYEEARYDAKTGQRGEGAKKILAFDWPGDGLPKLYGPGRALEEIGAFDDAEKRYRDYADKEMNPDGAFPLIQFWIRRGRTDSAVDKLWESRAAAPPESTARYLSLAVRSRVGAKLEPAEEVKWKARVAELDAWVVEQAKNKMTREEWLVPMAELADARGDYDRALALYTKAAENAAPESRASQLNNVAFMRALQKLDGGEETLRIINEALGLRGSVPSLLDTRAVVRSAGGDHAGAARDLELAIRADPRPAFYFHLALAFHRLNQPNQRDANLAEAEKRGLTPANLHPLEWDDYKKLTKGK